MSIGLRTQAAAFVTMVMITCVPSVFAQLAAPVDAEEYFVNIKEGDFVKNPFKVQFGMSGLVVASSAVQTGGTAHHVLLIDTEIPANQLKFPISTDSQHVHLLDGETDATLTLPVGKHTLQLIAVDWTQVPLTPPVTSEKITIEVQQ